MRVKVLVPGLSETMRSLRKSHNLLQKDVGQIMKVNTYIVTNYENGRRTPDLEYLANFSHSFGVSLDYLVGRSDNPGLCLFTTHNESEYLYSSDDYPVLQLYQRLSPIGKMQIERIITEHFLKLPRIFLPSSPPGLCDLMKYTRTKEEISQKNLAKIFNLKQSIIAGYETGSSSPDLGYLVRFADYFNVSLNHLLRDKVLDGNPVIYKDTVKTILLTEDQMRFIKIYRKLTVEDQHRIIGIIQVLTDTSKTSGLPFP